MKSAGNSVPRPSLFTLEDLPENQMGVQLLNCNAVLIQFIYNRKSVGSQQAFFMVSITRVNNI
jgi:hypothetical protein